MKNDLISVAKKEIATRYASDLDALLRPLTSDILLFDSYIGRAYKLKDSHALLSLKEGDILKFVTNASGYSPYEVKMFNEEGEHVGFAAEADEIVVSRLMNAGKKLYGVVKHCTFSNNYPVIEIQIFMKDF